MLQSSALTILYSIYNYKSINQVIVTFDNAYKALTQQYINTVYMYFIFKKILLILTIKLDTSPSLVDFFHDCKLKCLNTFT